MKKLFFSMLFSVLAINSAMAAAGTPAAPATTGFWSHFEGMNALTVVFASLCILRLLIAFTEYLLQIKSYAWMPTAPHRR